jgi:regulator of sigma E protease
MIILTSIVGFLLAIGVLVFIHELGHYLVARYLGFKVESFSIGFGKPIFSFTRLVTNKSGSISDEINYRLSILPLGGYVKILDGRDLSPQDKDYERSFIAASKRRRFMVLLAGPAFNLILAAFIFLILALSGSQKPLPWIAGIEMGSPAAISGMDINEKITSVNGRPVVDIGSLSLILIDEVTTSNDIEIGVISLDGAEKKYTINIDEMSKALTEPGNLFPALGIKLGAPVMPVIGEVIVDSPASNAGLLAGDRVISFNNIDIINWFQLVSLIRSHPGETVTMEVMRDGLMISLPTSLGVQSTDGLDYGRLGTTVDQVSLDTALGIGYINTRDNIFSGTVNAVVKTYEMSALTIKMLYRMVLGKVSIENISGPISIASFAGDTMSYGVKPFLGFLAIISISLGVLNLLPIPMLDGGQIMQLFIEYVKGSPLSDKSLLIGQQMGMVMIVLLMTIAIFNDINRFVL